MNNCSKCGAEREAFKKFCGECGTAYETEFVKSSDFTEQTQANPVKKKSFIKKLLLGIGVAFALFIALGVILALLEPVKDEMVIAPSEFIDTSEPVNESTVENDSSTSQNDYFFLGTEEEYNNLLAVAIASMDFSEVEKHPLYSEEDVASAMSGSTKVYDGNSENIYESKADEAAQQTSGFQGYSLKTVALAPDKHLICTNCNGTGLQVCMTCGGKGQVQALPSNLAPAPGTVGSISFAAMNNQCVTCWGKKTQACTAFCIDGFQGAINPAYKTYLTDLTELAVQTGTNVFKFDGAMEGVNYIGIGLCPYCLGEIVRNDYVCMSCDSGVNLYYLETPDEDFYPPPAKWEPMGGANKELLEYYKTRDSADWMKNSDSSTTDFGMSSEIYKSDGHTSTIDLGGESYGYCAYPNCGEKIYTSDAYCAWHR